MRLAIEGRLDLAVIAILVAAVLDGLDGRIARMMKGTSRFGAELESLSDFEDSVTTTLEDFTEKTTPEEILLSRLVLLPEKQRTVISLRLIEKLSLKEIAKRLDKNMNYVKTTQKRALKNLKEIFANNRCTLD